MKKLQWNALIKKVILKLVIEDELMKVVSLKLQVALRNYLLPQEERI
jgi:hypothetical protein